MKKRILFIVIILALGAFAAWLIWGRGTPIVFSVSVYVGKQPLQGAVVEIKGKKKMVDPDGTILFTDVNVHENEQIIITATKDESIKRETVTITSSNLSTELVNVSIVFPANFQADKTKPIDFEFRVKDGTEVVKSELILHDEHFVSDEEGVIRFKDSIKENKIPIYIQKIGSSKDIKDTVLILDEERSAGKVQRTFNFTGKIGTRTVVPLAITVHTNPIGATVSTGSSQPVVSGTNGTAVLDINTAVGSKVTVTIKKDKYQPKVTSFVVSEADASEGNKSLPDVELVPISEPGFADIITSPPGATIKMNSKVLPQKSPAKHVAIPSGGAKFTLTLGSIKRELDIPSFSPETYRGVIEVFMGDCTSAIQVCDSLSRKQISTYSGSINEQILAYLGQWMDCGCKWENLPINLRAQRLSLIGEACYRLGSDYNTNYYTACEDNLTQLIYHPAYKKVAEQYPKATYYLAMAEAKIGEQDPTGEKDIKAIDELKRVLESVKSSKYIISEEKDMMYKDISFELVKVSNRIYEYYLNQKETPVIDGRGGYPITDDQREEKRLEVKKFIQKYISDNCPDPVKDKECQYVRKLKISKNLKSIHEK